MMKHACHTTLRRLAAVLFALVLAAGVARALEVDFFTLEAGTTSTGGDFTLTGVIGQPEPGLLSGGEFTLQGGFLTAADTGPPQETSAAHWSLYP